MPGMMPGSSTDDAPPTCEDDFKGSSSSDEQYHVFIKNLHNSTGVMTVRGSDTIGNVKARLQVDEGFEPESYRLCHAGKLLDNMSTLRDCGIKCESVLNMMPCLAGGAKGVRKNILKDKTARMLDHQRATRTLQRQATEASTGLSALVTAVAKAVAAFQQESKTTVAVVLKRLDEDALERLNTSMQSNNQEHKINSLCREIFAAELADIAVAVQEVESLKEWLGAVVTEAFDRSYFGDDEKYDMKLYAKDIVTAMKRGNMKD
jgi:hypothetical protein